MRALVVMLAVLMSGCSTVGRWAYCGARTISGNTGTQLYERECRGRD